VLQAAGCDVADAADGREALTKALSQRPSVVIIETHLPIFDSITLCSVLRRDTVTRSVPILVLTTETQEAELNRAYAAGADAIAIKPLSPETLLQQIQRLLERPTRNATAETLEGAQSLSKTHSRFQTTTPPKTPPALVCPSCDGPLTYQRSHVGGVSHRHPEQWDEFSCPLCGTFEYRQRTRRLRRVG
jgi:two-component system chemotaxis response regulator CheY